ARKREKRRVHNRTTRTGSAFATVAAFASLQENIAGFDVDADDRAARAAFANELRGEIEPAAAVTREERHLLAGKRQCKIDEIGKALAEIEMPERTAECRDAGGAAFDHGDEVFQRRWRLHGSGNLERAVRRGVFVESRTGRER